MMNNTFWKLIFIGVMALNSRAGALCQDLPENDCSAPCGVSCDYRVPQTQSYQFDLPSLESGSSQPEIVGFVNRNVGVIQNGQSRPYILPFYIYVPADYYDRAHANQRVKISTIPFSTTEMGLGFQFQVTASKGITPHSRHPASANFTGTYIRCESRTKLVACAPTPPGPGPCSPTWSDTGCIGANSMGTYDSCNSVASSRFEASCTVAVAVNCVGSWGACVGVCGTGSQIYSIITPASVAPPGAACSNNSGDTQPCPLAACSPPPPPPPTTGTWEFDSLDPDCGSWCRSGEPAPTGSCTLGASFIQHLNSGCVTSGASCNIWQCR